jgi:hypothetical protein
MDAHFEAGRAEKGVELTSNNYSKITLGGDDY